MAAASEHELISRAAEFALRHAAEVEHDVHKQLETSSATSLVNALRMLSMLRAVVAIGSFSVFEAVVQQQTGWENPLGQIEQLLREMNNDALADRFNDYRNAINVLKHGKGRSYEALLKRERTLDFSLKALGESFFHEGDVSEGLHLVKADDDFGRQCAQIIRDVADALTPAVRLL